MALALIGISIYLCFRIFRRESTTVREFVTDFRRRYSRSMLVRHLIVNKNEKSIDFKNLLKHEGNLIKKGLKIVVQAKFINNNDVKNMVNKDTLQKVISENYDFCKTTSAALKLNRNEIAITLNNNKLLLFSVNKINGCFYDKSTNLFSISVKNTTLGCDEIFMFFIKDNRITSGYAVARLVEMILKLQSINKSKISSTSKRWFVGSWTDFSNRYSSSDCDQHLQDRDLLRSE